MKYLSIFFLCLIASCSSIEERSEELAHKVEFKELWNYSDTKQTRNEFLILLRENSKKKGLDWELQLQTQIARTYSLALQFDEAHKVLSEVSKKLSDQTKIARIRYNLELGRTYNSSKLKGEAIPLFKKAFELSLEIQHDYYAIDAAHMMAIASEFLDEKIDWSIRGIKVATDSDHEDVKRWIGIFYNNLGWDLFEINKYSEALSYFKKCRDFHEAQNDESSLNIAIWSIGKTYRMLGEMSKALEIQTLLLADAGDVDRGGYVYEELGELYLIKGDTVKSSKYFSKAYKILSKDPWLKANESERLERIFLFSM